MNQLLLSVQNITIRLREQFLFHNTSWQLRVGEQWLILGENGSGKTTFAKAIAGLLPLKSGEIILHFVDGKFPYPQLYKDKIIYVSFDSQQHILTRDSLKRDFEAYVGKESPGTTVRDFFGELGVINYETSKKNHDSLFILTHSFLDRELSTLSTGEIRKVFLIKALIQNPKILILDEPFDGLDFNSKEILMKMIENIIERKKMSIIIIVHKPEEIPESITNVMIMKDGHIERSGKKTDIIHKTQTRQDDLRFKTEDLREKNHKSYIMNPKSPEVLIDMQNVTVKYGDKTVLDNINWQMREGENWAILGHNGAGKSTFLQLITGNHNQRFANNITIFGKKKDEGISVWDIKSGIGIVSQDIMIKHVYEMKAESVILSGFFDSIGLYKSATDSQKKLAGEWIKNLGLLDISLKNYQELSYGQKRLILIARAVVKSPKILILDEPCHGLDTQNRQKVLRMIDEIGNTQTNLLYVTHNPDEIVSSITNVLKLENGKVIKKIKTNEWK